MGRSRFTQKRRHLVVDPVDPRKEELEQIRAPITDLVDLCDRYTEAEWAAAAFRSASDQVEELCRLMERLARWRA